MGALQETERALYAEAWALPSYAAHSPGEQRVNVFLNMAGLPSGISPEGTWYTVLDAGCGSGKGALALSAVGFYVRMCDITPDGLIPEAARLSFYRACLWQDLKLQLPYVAGGAYDYVYCADVLEHIPQQFTMLVVDQLLRVSRRGVFLSISLAQDVFGLWLGQHLHQTVQTFNWWKSSLEELGTMVEARDLIDSAVFLVKR